MGLFDFLGQAASDAVRAEQRRNRQAVPVVGPHGANQVRLSPALRAMLLRRVTREVHQETDPIIAQLQSQLPALHEALQSEKRSIKGATEMAADAVSDISLKGLHGQARHQLAEERTQREADILASVPFQMADARSEFQTQRTDLMQQVAEAQAQQQAGIASAFNSALGEARTDAQSTVKARQTAQQADSAAGSKDSKEAHQQFNMALDQAKSLLTTYAGQVPNGDDEWERFAQEVAKAEGIHDLDAVHAAIARIKALLQANKSDFAETVNVQRPAAEALQLAQQIAERVKNLK